jgi:hypothetical protein
MNKVRRKSTSAELRALYPLLLEEKRLKIRWYCAFGHLICHNFWLVIAPNKNCDIFS